MPDRGAWILLRRVVPVAWLLLTLSPLGRAGDDGLAEGIEYFETHIRPLLAGSCYECHSDQGEGVKAGLNLDSKAGILKGGDSGALFKTGDPLGSLLVKAVTYQLEDLEMPPRKKLADKDIEHLQAWIQMGAPMPEDGVVLADSAAGFDFEAFRKDHWAFGPVQKPSPPTTDSDWVRSPIDAFVLARLEKAGLSPAPKAESRVLLRRAAFTLTGLPPTPEEMQSFLADESPRAFTHAVERLLASPAYGERWGCCS